MALEHLLGLAWAEHLRKTDNTLPFDQRLKIVDSRMVVDTFVDMISKSKYTSRVSHDDIYEMTMLVILQDTLESPYALQTILLYSYAEHVLLILRKLKYENCYGCSCIEQYGPGGHPSQREHMCLEDEDILLGMHFDDCLPELDEESLLTTFAEKLYEIDVVVSPNVNLQRSIKYELEGPGIFSYK